MFNDTISDVSSRNVTPFKKQLVTIEITYCLFLNQMGMLNAKIKIISLRKQHIENIFMLLNAVKQ